MFCFCHFTPLTVSSLSIPHSLSWISEQFISWFTIQFNARIWCCYRWFWCACCYQGTHFNVIPFGCFVCYFIKLAAAHFQFISYCLVKHLCADEPLIHVYKETSRTGCIWLTYFLSCPHLCNFHSLTMHLYWIRSNYGGKRAHSKNLLPFCCEKAIHSTI